MRSALHDFWCWVGKRKFLTPDQMPEFPEIKYELRVRNTVSKRVQESILAEVHRISFHINPRIWIGTKWLCTYISIRPGELRRIKEKDINLSEGFLLIPHPEVALFVNTVEFESRRTTSSAFRSLQRTATGTPQSRALMRPPYIPLGASLCLRTGPQEKKPKFVPLLEEDVELVRKLPRGFPEMPFFRHMPGVSGCKAGQTFGDKYLYKWWKKACENLGIKGVDLYGGTRHSSAIALRKLRTPEEIKRATMHSTNKAFERYFRIEAEDLRDIYRDTREKRRGEVEFRDGRAFL